jgi:putative tricarboxylic transport membrane protein
MKAGEVFMKDLLTIDIQYSEYHIIFPKIIGTILVILLLAMGLQALIKKFKGGKLKEFTFFDKDLHKLKFFGTIGLLIVYVFFLEIIGFIPSSIAFMFLLTALFRGDLKKNTLVVSAANAVVTSVLVWFFFGYLFDITLP